MSRAKRRLDEGEDLPSPTQNHLRIIPLTMQKPGLSRFESVPYIPPDSPKKCPERPSKKQKPLIQENTSDRSVKLIARVNKYSPYQDQLTEIEVHSDKAPTRYTTEFFEQSTLGRGDFSVVTKCRHRIDGWTYAIKKLTPGPQTSTNIEDAFREAHVCAALNNPYIVRYYNCWPELVSNEDTVYIQFEYCAGGALSRSEYKDILFDQNICCLILNHITQALDYLHRNNFHHGDVKPANILVSTDLALERITPATIFKLSDFGISNQLEAGDPNYGPAEILDLEDNPVDAATKKIWCLADVFSLGMSVYELAYQSSNDGKKLDSIVANRNTIRSKEIKLSEPFTSPFVKLLQRMMDHHAQRPSSQDCLKEPLIQTLPTAFNTEYQPQRTRTKPVEFHLKSNPLNFSLDPTGPPLPPSKTQKKNIRGRKKIEQTNEDNMQIESPPYSPLPIDALPVTPISAKKLDKLSNTSSGRITRSKARGAVDDPLIKKINYVQTR